MIPPAANCSASADALSAFMALESSLPVRGAHQAPVARDGRVSWNEIGGGGLGPAVERTKSVFHRLGPKLEMCDPPYVPESIGEPPLPGMIFGCTNETFAECMKRELFGLPIANKPQVMRIAPGASLFLFNFRTKRLHGIFEATSHGGVHIVRDAFCGKFAAQVKFRLSEDCPSLDEMEFKEAILTNYVDARKFKFFLNEDQVCRLRTLFREKAVHAWAVSEGIVSHKASQLRLSEQQHSRNTFQVQASPSRIRSRPAKDLEVSMSRKDKRCDGAPDPTRRHVVLYDQSSTPVLRSKVIRPVSEGRPGGENPQDRKRCADRGPHERSLLLGHGREIGENRPAKAFTDLRELLTRPNLKRLKSLANESARRRLSKPLGPVDSGRKIMKSDVLSDGISIRDLEQGLPPPSDGMQSQTLSGSHCANPTPMVLGTDGREVNEAWRSDNAVNSMAFGTADGNGAGSCQILSTSSTVKSRVLNLDDVRTESNLGDQSKDGRLNIDASLSIEEDTIARETDSQVPSEIGNGKGGGFSCILGKRSRESNEHEPTLDSFTAAQAPNTEWSDKEQKEGPRDSHADIPSSLAIASECLQENKNATCVASAEEQYLTSQARGSVKMGNLSEGEKRQDHEDLIRLNDVPLSEATPAVCTVNSSNTGDMQLRDCKSHRAEKENKLSSPVHKMKKVGQNDAGCSYITPSEGGHLREKIPQKHGVDNRMPLQIPSNSIKSGNLWNSRTFRYGRPRSADAVSDLQNTYYLNSGSERTSASGKSELDVVVSKSEEETVGIVGEDFENSIRAETSRTVGSPRHQHAVLICEPGNPGGLPLDVKTIEVDTLDESLGSDQLGRVAAVAQEFMMPAETDSTSGIERVQSLSAALDPTSDELKTIESRKEEIAAVQRPTEDESRVTDGICDADVVPLKKRMQPTLSTCNGGGSHPSFLSYVTLEADAPQGAGAVVEDDSLHCLDATRRGFPVACTSTVSDCSDAPGEAELVINIPVEREELEINIPIEKKELEINNPAEKEELEIPMNEVLEINISVEKEELEVRLLIEKVEKVNAIPAD